MTPHHHTCEICGHSWPCGLTKGPKDPAKCEVRKAARQNRQGPFCLMCLWFNMATAAGSMRGMTPREAFDKWAAPKND